MIHVFTVNQTTEPEDLLKVVRKHLMTGGAVVRLEPGLSADDLLAIYDRYSPRAEPNSLAAQVLVQLAQAASVTDEAVTDEAVRASDEEELCLAGSDSLVCNSLESLIQKLRASELPEVKRVTGKWKT